ncbi:MAG TPA: DUF5677 domain-containing protein, partial [Candidatus Limnocylindrales bacterium]|nr:DUF5677 domain-containing protein [Candidatus Limnocylindrales bacterium]
MIKKEVKEIDNLICDLIQKTSKRIKEKAKINNNYQLLALFFFSKVAKSYRAVERLCYSGYGQDALVLGRTIFEHMVTLSYINKDPGERVELFID